MSRVQRFAAPLVIAVLLIASAVWFFGSGSDQKTLTAYFPRAVSIYEGSDVRILGVPVGTIDEVTPEGTRVKVVMRYDPEIEVSDQAKAVIVSPALVGDRYIQLTSASEGDGTLADGTVLDEGRTAVPLELDEIFSSIDRLTVAVGPDGANANGALSDLLETTAANFGGQGAQFNQTIENFSRLSRTLDNNKEELFGSAAKLQRFITTLARNDTTVRNFNTSLGEVSTLLAGERQELAAALSNLGTALDEVGSFVDENREILGENISGLNRVTQVLVRQREALDETLRLAPLALNNLALTYNPDTGTLDTNANIGNLVDEIESNPSDVLCALVSANDADGEICGLIQGLPLPRPGTFGAGTGTEYGDQVDRTLNGLVEVDE